GIEVQKRRLGSMGALASTINIIVLDNPMTFHFSQFLDSALGQIVGCMLAFIVILLVRDKSKDRTGRVLLNQFVSSAVSAMTTNVVRRKENRLPALYQQLFLQSTSFKTILNQSVKMRCINDGRRKAFVTYLPSH
ncbi:p-hydroxybenzoic acid efflux subunit AaeB, partial [Salmonella enterica subsp. enterica serovar Enteritidis str. 13183-1]